MTTEVEDTMIIVIGFLTIDVMTGIVRDLFLLHILASEAAMNIHQERTVCILFYYFILLILDDISFKHLFFNVFQLA
jgi:hypothetical protein